LRAASDGVSARLTSPGIREELELKMKILRSIRELDAALAPLRVSPSLGLVPTMGALHGGHAALFRAARAECDTVVASVFVNPAQFTDPADLDMYPRALERDAELASGEGVDFVFAPSAEDLYPPGFATWVDPEGAAVGLEGAHRSGHFRGVGTVCAKLFNIVRPQRAYFGRKDAQQVAVIKQLVRDLNFPLEIRVVQTVRDEDGLALSSRNVRLSTSERASALAIPRALATRDPRVARAILAEAGIEPEYVAVTDLDGPTLAIAAQIGGARLIDNVLLEGGDSL
jgi:pantoate--beta-alanine ligase